MPYVLQMRNSPLSGMMSLPLTSMECETEVLLFSSEMMFVVKFVISSKETFTNFWYPMRFD